MKQVGKMNQKLMIENLKELRSELWKHAAGSESITPGAWTESLDKAIATLERIRWRRVGNETPKAMGPYDSKVDVLTFIVADDGRFSYISTTGYYHNRPNPWCEARGVHTVCWAYLPEMPEEGEQ